MGNHSKHSVVKYWEVREDGNDERSESRGCPTCGSCPAVDAARRVLFVDTTLFFGPLWVVGGTGTPANCIALF